MIKTNSWFSELWIQTVGRHQIVYWHVIQKKSQSSQISRVLLTGWKLLCKTTENRLQLTRCSFSFSFSTSNLFKLVKTARAILEKKKIVPQTKQKLCLRVVLFHDKLKQPFYVRWIYSENSGIKTREIYKKL